MKLHELHAIPGANKAVTRKGRGIGSGNGKTAGFGSKGQGPFRREARWFRGRPDASGTPPAEGWL